MPFRWKLDSGRDHGHVANVFEPMTKLSKSVRHAAKCEPVVIAVDGKPAAGSQPLSGLMKNKWPLVRWWVFARMSDEEAAKWGL
jgi:antitoxin (DNA-binding transcriptional repressor) of toxin-antitoxin stability system